MEQSRKQLKTASIIVLVFAGLSMINLILEICFGELNSAEIPEGSPENILLITKLILLSVSLLLMIPRFYVGFKGLIAVKKPGSLKSPIVWAALVMGFELVSVIGAIVAIVKQEDVGENVSLLCSALLEVLVYYDFIKCARETEK